MDWKNQFIISSDYAIQGVRRLEGHPATLNLHTAGGTFRWPFTLQLVKKNDNVKIWF